MQPARRERREDGADSGDADESEGAEAPGGFLCLVVERCGATDRRASEEDRGGIQVAKAGKWRVESWGEEGAEGGLHAEGGTCTRKLQHVWGERDSR